MNIENVTKLRDHLLHLQSIGEQRLFYMPYYLVNMNKKGTYIKPPLFVSLQVDQMSPDVIEEHSCKTAGCLAGWAFYLSTGSSIANRKVSIETVKTLAREWLDLSPMEASDWFTGFWDMAEDKAIEDLTIEDAVAFLNKELSLSRAVTTPAQEGQV